MKRHQTTSFHSVFPRSLLSLVWLAAALSGPLSAQVADPADPDAAERGSADGGSADGGSADGGSADGGSADAQPSQRAEQLVGQLGAPTFQQRALAGQALRKLGVAALGAIEQGRESEDPEIRRRCDLLLAVIIRSDRRERIAEFARLTTQLAESEVDKHAERLDLPGWNRFAEVVGRSANDRVLYQAILTEEWDLIARAVTTPVSIPAELEQRFEQLEPGGTVVEGDSAIRTAAFFFATLLARDRITDSVSNQLYIQAAYRPDFGNFVNSQRGLPARRLLAAWIRSVEGGTNCNFHALTLAERFELPQAGAERARKALEGPQMPQLTVRALEVMAHFGSAADVPLVTGFLDDQRSVKHISISISNPSVPGAVERLVMETRICDLALFAAVVIAGADPLEFGFEHLPSGPAYQYADTHVGFATDDARRAAIARWKAFHTKRTGES